MRKILFTLMLVFISGAFAKNLKFSDFTVPVYQGKVVSEAQRNNAYAKKYKTSLKYGLQEYGVNFAGHYSLIPTGCGVDCRTYAIVDVKTGKVYHDKWLKEFGSMMGPVADFDAGEYQNISNFRKDSRLLVMIGSYGTVKGSNKDEQGLYWLEFKNGRLHLLKKIPM